ncbi:MAG TPA: phosphate acyltransferase PlsX [Chloroflexia bacterium]|nr:phosphate acyltransferase PlsX [Chloroflexia bacterium]
MRIVLDAMGGDDAPLSPVAGAVMAVREYANLDMNVILVGREDVIKAELRKHDLSGGLESRLPVVNATEVVEMDEHPAQAVRRKRDSSVVVGLNLLKKGEADAFVSAGHSGATMAASTLIAPNRIRGVERAALATVFPSKKGPILVLDVGANTEVKPEYLVQFAQMGKVYSEKVLRKKNPTIGLLSNGEEENKGSMLVQEAHQLLRQTAGLNFKGNAEGKDVLEGSFDVVVTDGFTGNVLLKATEGAASMILKTIKEELTSNLLNKVLALGLKPAFKKVQDRLDHEKYGGAPLLGVNGVVIITHGRMKPEGIKNAIRVAGETYQNGTVEGIKALFATKTSQEQEAEVNS